MHLNDPQRSRAGQYGVAEGDPRWAAVRDRDAGVDGAFFYAVSTTGIYCRPSCGARLPKRAHVVYFDSAAAAERAGFRPCKRCRPRELSPVALQVARVAELCRFIARSDEPVALRELAERTGLSASYTQRLFKRVTGLTPKQYAAALRAGRVRAELRERNTVTEAIYEAGYASASRFYARSERVLGMTPTEYRAGGAGLAIRFAVGECSLGSILVAATERGVCAISLGDDPLALVSDLERRFSKAELVAADRGFERSVATVIGFVEQPRATVDLPLDIRGTVFQQRVWAALSRIPAGETMSYAELARAIGAPGAVRAVGRACGANPLAVAIPCHRVVRRDGGLAGYRWGLERKRALLARESG